MNNALIGMGVIDEPLALMWNEVGVTIGMVHYMLPLGILPLWAAMRDIDRRVLAASRGLGASALQTFLRVFLPLSLPGVIGAGLLVFIFSLGFFVTPAILGGGKTHHGRRVHQRAGPRIRCAGASAPCSPRPWSRPSSCCSFVLEPHRRPAHPVRGEVR